MSFDYTDENIDKIISKLSDARLSKYLYWSKDDKDLAIKLYEANTKVSESLYTPLQNLEVLIRNEFHRLLSESYGDEWYENPMLIKSKQKERIDKAKETLKTNITPDRVVAELSLGFWVNLLNRHMEDLWRKCLHKAFIESEYKLIRKDAHAELERLRILRNRIAHHEPIIHKPYTDNYNKIIEIISWICMDCSEWTESISNTEEVVQQHSQLLRGISYVQTN